MYDAQVDSIDVDDIAEDSNNIIVMSRIKRNNANENDELWIKSYHEDDEDDDGEYCVDYVPEGAYDMGWLGYFVGKNDYLQELRIRPFTLMSGVSESVRDVLVPFLRGVNRNKSIRKINFNGVDLLGGEVFTMLGSFFQSNHNLTNIYIRGCDFGDEGVRLFALALGSSTNKSLQNLDVQNNNIADEGMVDIITALSKHPHLNRLDLEGNRLRKNGCVALGTLLRCSATELQYLYLANNEINDEGIEVLVPVLTNCYHLKQFRLCDNPLISTRGWQSLAATLESPNSHLEELYIYHNNVDDQAAIAFVGALTNNHTLCSLDLDENPSITTIGWQSFSKTLCNTSTVNSTFLSNHTLNYLGANAITNETIEPLLELNARDDKKEVAVIKILQCHDDFDMQPFFEWEFKVLPLVLSWLERASECEMPEGFEPNIEERKLSTIYQFVRGMPVLYVETRLRKELEDIKVEESQMEEEEEQQEFLKRKQLLQRRKESIMKRLGGKLQQR